MPDPDALRAEIIKRQIPVFSPAEALAIRTCYAMYAEPIKRRLADVSHAEQVQKFTLAVRGFTPESGELTLKLSLKRNVVPENFAAEIDAMYRESERLANGRYSPARDCSDYYLPTGRKVVYKRIAVKSITFNLASNP